MSIVDKVIDDNKRIARHYFNFVKREIDALEQKKALTDVEKNKLLILTGKLEACFYFLKLIG